MEATSATPTGSSEPQPGPRTRLCSLEDKTPGPMAPWQLGTGDRQPHVPEVAARMEAPPGATQGPGPSPASHPRAPPRKPRCPRVQLTPARTPSLKSFQPDTMGDLPAQAGRLDSSDHQGDGGGRGCPGWPWLPASGLESWHQPCPQPGDAGGQKTAELREDHRASTGPQGQTPPAPSPRTGHLSPRRDSLDSSSSTPGDHLGARLTHFGGLWRAGERGPLGSGPGPRSLSEQVEKNRLLLREMLRGGGAATLKPGTPSCDRAVPGRPAGDADGDLEGTRTCGSPTEPTPRPGQDRLPPPQARVKARMRPLRASHDIMPTLAPDRSLTPATPPRPWAQVSTDPPWTSAARPHPPPAGRLLLSTSNCKDIRPGGRTETDPHGPEPPLASESPGHGGPQAVASGGLSAEPGCSPEADGAPQQSGATSGQPATPRQAQGDPAGPSPPAAAPWDRSRRSGGRGGFAPGLGLKKIFSALGQAARPLAGRTRSHSVEQLRTPTPGPGTPEARRAPSLQFLHLVSRSPQRGKSPSFHSLQALLSGRGDRANLYRVQEPAGDSSAGSTPPRRALSVEDVGAPSRARTVGRVVAAFPDGTSQLQLQCSPGGTFGFSVAAGSGRRDSGLYVRAMADVGTAKLYSGLLAVGDEILEVDGAKVAALGTAHVQELLARADSVSLRVLRQRPAPR